MRLGGPPRSRLTADDDARMRLPGSELLKIQKYGGGGPEGCWLRKLNTPSW